MAYGGERRERKPFEPPPWEREAFEQIAGGRERPEARAEPAPRVVPPIRDAGANAGADAQALPEDFDAMLADLRYTEAESSDGAGRVGAWVALIVAVFGVVLFVWGTVALFSGGGKLNAVAMAVVLMSVGGLFAGAGAWSAMKNLKRQGVL